MVDSLKALRYPASRTNKLGDASPIAAPDRSKACIPVSQTLSDIHSVRSHPR